MVKNLITGIGGFVASHLADYLLSKGEEVYGTFRWNEDLSRIQHIKDKITMIPADLLDLSSMIDAVEISKPHYVYHLAAQSYVSDSFNTPSYTIQVNTIGTLNLLDAIRKRVFKPIIHICSSSEVYGQVKESEIPIKETNMFRPANPYAVGKVGADMIAYQYGKSYGMNIIRTRMFTHFAPRRTMKSAEVNFASQIAMIEQGFQEPIIKHGNLDSIRTWADARDAVRAYYELVRKCTVGEVYNIGGNRTEKIGWILDYLISISSMSNEIKKEQDPSLMRPSDVTLQIPDISKFKKEVPDWEPTYSLEQSLQDLLDWCREEIKNGKRF